MDTTYIFSLSYDPSRKELVLFRTDPIKLAIAGGKYRPAIARAERDNDFSYYENVYALVKAALCGFRDDSDRYHVKASRGVFHDSKHASRP